jgi:hypothetical protein
VCIIKVRNISEIINIFHPGHLGTLDTGSGFRAEGLGSLKVAHHAL